MTVGPFHPKAIPPSRWERRAQRYRPNLATSLDPTWQRPHGHAVDGTPVLARPISPAKRRAAKAKRKQARKAGRR